MRRPLLTAFALASLLGLTAISAACAKSEDPDLLGALQSQNPTDPEDSGTGSAKLPPKSVEKAPPVVVDAGKPTPPAVVDAGKDAAKEDPPEEPPEDPPECPQDLLHSLAAVSSQKSCVNGGSDCDPGECCFVNLFTAQANKCVPE